MLKYLNYPLYKLDNLFSNITTSWFELPIEQISGEVTENIWTFDKKAKVILNYTYTQLSSNTGFDYLTILINDKKVAITPSVNAISHEYLPINISGIAIFNCEVNDVLSIQSHNNVVKYFKSNTWSMTYF